MGRWVEVIEAEDGRLSITRLLCLLSFFPASFVLLSSPNDTLFGLYVGTYAVSYIGGKTADIFIKPKS